jgi:N-acetylglutamate synthase-like GNAT family acetyltransferase
MSAVCSSGHGSTVGIWTMSTPPAKQRQGAGRAVLLAVMQDHAKRGAQTFYLIATEAGKPPYDNLGFETVDELSIWLVGESSQFPVH